MRLLPHPGHACRVILRPLLAVSEHPIDFNPAIFMGCQSGNRAREGWICPIRWGQAQQRAQPGRMSKSKFSNITVPLLPAWRNDSLSILDARECLTRKRSCLCRALARHQVRQRRPRDSLIQRIHRGLAGRPGSCQTEDSSRNGSKNAGARSRMNRPSVRLKRPAPRTEIQLSEEVESQYRRRPWRRPVLRTARAPRTTEMLSEAPPLCVPAAIAALDAQALRCHINGIECADRARGRAGDRAERHSCRPSRRAASRSRPLHASRSAP